MVEKVFVIYSLWLQVIASNNTIKYEFVLILEVFAVIPPSNSKTAIALMCKWYFNSVGSGSVYMTIA